MFKKNHIVALRQLLICCCLSFQFVLANALLANNDEIDETEASELFAWFDTLGYKEFDTLPFVKIQTGRWSKIGDEDPKNKIIFGFLTEDTKKQFKVCTFWLEEQVFTPTPEGTEKHEIVAYERADLVKFAHSVIQAHKDRESATEIDHWRRFGEQIDESAEIVILARACHARMQGDLALSLLNIAQAMVIRERIEGDPRLQQAFSEKLAHSTMWQLIVDFGDPKITRNELLQRLDRFVKNFPDSSHHQRAKESAELLRKMVAEDAAHRSPTNFTDLSSKEKVAELIYRLRDQNGQQFSQPGSCNIFSEDDYGMYMNREKGEKHEPSAAQQLVEIGFDAVPQLIEVLEDKRFTRSVGYHRDFYFSHHVLRYGDAAEQIVCRIANRDFYQRTYTNGGMTKDGEATTVKQRVEEWWKEVQEKGEKQVLIEATQLGDRNSAAQAQRLANKYPDAALQPIIVGARKADSDWVRGYMIQIAGSLGKQAKQFLSEEMENAPALVCRVVAAWKLRTSEPERVKNTMIAEWKTLNSNEKKPYQREFGEIDGIDELISLLATMNSPECIKALHEYYDRLPIDVRMDVISAVAVQQPHSFYFQNLLNENEKDNKPDPKVEKEIEALLITAMGDTERRVGMSSTRGGISFNDPRVCDYTAYYLNDRFPAKYKIDLEARFDEIESQRINVINQWRKENGIDQMPKSEPFMISRAPKEKTDPIIKVLMESTGEAQTSEAVDALEAIGVNALPTVLESIEKLSDNPAKMSMLSELARHLSTAVVVIDVDAESAPLSDEFKKQLEALRDQPLQKEKLVALMLAVTKKLPDGVTGIKISAQRVRVESAVALTVCLVKGRVEGGDEHPSWDYHWSVRAGKETLGSVSGGGINRIGTEMSEFDDFTSAVEKALQSDADTPFEMRYTIVADE